MKFLTGVFASVLLILGTVICAQLSYALNFLELTGRIFDKAQLLDSTQEESLSAQLEAHEEKTSNQVVVTISGLEGYAIADYANRLGRAW